MSVFNHFLIQLVIVPNMYVIAAYIFLAIIFIWLLKAGIDLITDKSDES